jgi:hypothetical protein
VGQKLHHQHQSPWTRDINKAVANNPDKFPVGYVVELSKQEKSELVENFHQFNKLKHSTVNPNSQTHARILEARRLRTDTPVGMPGGGGKEEKASGMKIIVSPFFWFLFFKEPACFYYCDGVQ